MTENLENLIKRSAGLTDDSRKVKKDYIYVAINGRTVDGHDHIDEAIRNGASLIYGERDLNLSGAKYVKVKDTREKLGELASIFYGNPSEKLKIIGVTGTKGKTTTSHLIYHVLSSVGKKVGLISSIVAKIEDREIDTGFHVTSPDTISLHKFLKEMFDSGCEYAVIEVSSHGIDQKRIAGVKFEIGVLTNIAPEHIDYHKTFEEYKKTKMSFLNSAKVKVISPESTKLDVLPGEFNNINLETAIDVVKHFGVSESDALRTMKTFKLPEGRLEEIKNPNGARIFIDFAHTPESLEAALSYMKSQTKGKLIAVFGSAGERDRDKRPRMGKVAGELADVIIITAEDPRTEKVEDITKQIRAGISGESTIYEISDRKLAIAKAMEIGKKGDVIAILGKGHEKSMNLDGKTEIPWSDQEVVRDFLSKNKE